ncbi:MAG: lysophospholipid acyltransferase family protein [Chitinophagales bacterium]
MTAFWTLYALIIFIIIGSSFFLVELILLALGNISYRAAHRWPALCTKVLLFFWGIRVKQHNTDILKELPQCVIVINHRSDLDALIATAYMPGIYKFIGKRELIHYPFIGKLVERLYITVDRSDKLSRIQSLRNMKKESHRGAHIVVFPEGWSNFSKNYLLDLKRGAFKVALDLQVPILVCSFIGTHERFPKPKISLSPGKVDVYWEKLIQTEGLNYDDDSEKIKKEVELCLLDRLKQHYPNGYIYDKNQMDFDLWVNKQLKK